MKKFMSLVLIATLVLGNISFATVATPKVTAPPTVAPPSLTVKVPVNFKLNEGIDSTADFSKEFLHNAKNIDAYTFPLVEKDFATSKWQKYITAVYTQSTDINYYVSVIFADGSLKQSIELSAEKVQAIIDEAKKSNEIIQLESQSKPDLKFIDFYTKVNQAPYLLLDEKALVTYEFLTKNDIQNNYPDMADLLVNNMKVYQKGSFYIMMTTTYPSGTWTSLVSSSTTELDTAIGKFIAKNNEILVNAKLIEMPKPVVIKPVEVPKKPVVIVKPVAPKLTFYVLLIKKDKTFALNEFKTEAEAKKFQTNSIKAYGKANVIFFNNKKMLDDTIAKLKLKKKK
jgi:hypothetical protein